MRACRVHVIAEADKSRFDVLLHVLHSCVSKAQREGACVYTLSLFEVGVIRHYLISVPPVSLLWQRGAFW